jgi:hypothetical protein
VYVPFGKTTNSDLYIQNHKLCRIFVGDFDLPQCCCNPPPAGQGTTTHTAENTEITKKKKTCDGLFFPTHLAAHILLSQISTSLESPKNVILGERFESNDEVIEEVAARTTFNLVQEGERGTWFSLAQGC